MRDVLFEEVRGARQVRSASAAFPSTNPANVRRAQRARADMARDRVMRAPGRREPVTVPTDPAQWLREARKARQKASVRSRRALGARVPSQNPHPRSRSNGRQKRRVWAAPDALSVDVGCLVQQRPRARADQPKPLPIHTAEVPLGSPPLPPPPHSPPMPIPPVSRPVRRAMAPSGGRLPESCRNMHTRTCAHTYVHVCRHMYTYAHICTSMHTYAHVCTRMHT